MVDSRKKTMSHIREIAPPGLKTRATLLLVVLLSGWLDAAEAESQPDLLPLSGIPRALRDDAALNRVTFVDARLGWAVGNWGVVLHTDDGGRSWQQQESGTQATLEAVYFVDRQIGYAAGGRAWPEGGGTSGVLLRTEDGGRNWIVVPRVQTGWLRAVWADADGGGWLLGEPTPTRSAGVWRFSGAGRRIQPVEDRPLPAILAAGFTRDGRGIAVGREGTCIILRSGELTPQRRAVSYQGRLSGVALAGGRRAFMVGDGATIFSSDDAGRTWASVRLDLSAGARELADLSDLAFADGEHGWALGSNGHFLLQTDDGGSTWQPRQIGLRAPLRAIAAIDGQTLVGVGEWGLVARSKDGGRTWSAIRHGDRGIGALVVGTAPEPWPWPTMAHLAGHYRCRTAYLRATNDGVSAAAIRSAANACGVSTAATLEEFDEPPPDWQIPATAPAVRRSGTLPAYDGPFGYWSRRLDRDAEQAMRRRIASVVRSLRPAVVIIDDTSQDENVVASSVARLALEAIDQAAQSDAMPEQGQIGLSPYRVQRVIERVGQRPPNRRAGPDRRKDSIRVGFADGLHPLLGSDSRMAALRAFAHLEMSLQAPEISAAFRVVRGDSPGKPSAGLLAGLRLADEARLPYAPVSQPARLADLKAATDALTVAVRLSERRDNPAQLVQLAVRTAREFPDSLAPADALYQAGLQHEHLGQHRAAEEVWRAFFDLGRYHPAWSSVVIRQASQQASVERDMSLPVRPNDPSQGCRVAVQMIERLCDQRPYMADQPRVIFALAHCRRMLNQASAARNLYRRCVLSRAPGWSTAAAGELWLMEDPARRRDTCPRRIIEARHTAEILRIDGELDEPVWKKAAPLTLGDATGKPPPNDRQTAVRLAWNQVYLYLAVTVRTTHGRTGPPRQYEPRGGHLDQDWPRIECFFDIDRDAATWFRVAVDEIGNWLHASTDDLSWSLPLQAGAFSGAWQYMIQHDEHGWRLEMAVPMGAILPRPPTAGQVWAIQVVRRPGSDEPQVTTQWLAAQPGEQPAPEHFALLMLAAR
jgi:photosystem II stability/assembly factor-like uncharacterized protein